MLMPVHIKNQHSYRPKSVVRPTLVEGSWLKIAYKLQEVIPLMDKILHQLIW